MAVRKSKNISAIHYLSVFSPRQELHMTKLSVKCHFYSPRLGHQRQQQNHFNFRTTTTYNFHHFPHTWLPSPWHHNSNLTLSISTSTCTNTSSQCLHVPSSHRLNPTLTCRAMAHLPTNTTWGGLCIHPNPRPTHAKWKATSQIRKNDCISEEKCEHCAFLQSNHLLEAVTLSDMWGPRGCYIKDELWASTLLVSNFSLNPKVVEREEMVVEDLSPSGCLQPGSLAERPRISTFNNPKQRPRNRQVNRLF